jgi:hypothetical protein
MFDGFVIVSFISPRRPHACLGRPGGPVKIFVANSSNCGSTSFELFQFQYLEISGGVAAKQLLRV